MKETQIPLRRGFTLVELLVVIAILIALTAIVFAFFKGARESAMSAKCVNNMKQIAVTAGSIVNDNNGYIVHPGRTPVGGGPRRNWAMHFTTASRPELDYRHSRWSEINLQVSSVEMLSCPAAYREQWQTMVEKNGQARWRTYGINTRLGIAPGQYNAGGGNSDGGWIDGAVTPMQIEDPSLTILAAEAGWNGNAYRAGFGPASTRDNGMGDHHNGAFHVAYWDGHVQRLKYDEFPFLNNEMPDGRTVRIRTGNNATETDKYFSMVWRGTKYRRDIPKTPPE